VPRGRPARAKDTRRDGRVACVDTGLGVPRARRRRGAHDRRRRGPSELLTGRRHTGQAATTLAKALSVNGYLLNVIVEKDRTLVVKPITMRKETPAYVAADGLVAL